MTTERGLPDNLALLYSLYGREAIAGILPGESFDVDGTTFVCQYLPESTPDRFYIVKSAPLIERYRALCQEFSGGTIVELGIAEGGSTALMALWAKPRRLVAVDLEPNPLLALAEFLDGRGLQDVVRPMYGIDQSDRATLAERVDAALAGEQVDLVVDDCSHQLGPTRSSFETLFSRLRPGGLYVIEDWNLDHVMRESLQAAFTDESHPDHATVIASLRAAMASGDAGPPPRPLLQLAVELVLARASLGDVIAEVTVDEYWIRIRRGHDEIDPTDFRLGDLYSDHFGFLPASS